jgi:RNA polymerase sigma factor (sigma-70 family)
LIDEQQFIDELLDERTKNRAFSLLIDKYQKPLYQHIRHIVINHEDAQDALQNTFVNVFRGLPNFKRNSKLFSWMYKIAQNEALSILQKNAKSKKTSIEDVQHQNINGLQASAYFDGDAIQKALHLAVLKLPQQQQLIFKMKYFEDLKYEEIAEILSLSVGGLKAAYHIAVKKIELEINKISNDETPL